MASREITREELGQYFNLSSPQIARPPASYSELLLWWADNCEKLSELLGQVILGNTNSEYHVGCRVIRRSDNYAEADAIGHAALFSIIPGLQWTIYHSNSPRVAQCDCLHYIDLPNRWTTVMPMVNGEPVFWEFACEYFFGSRVWYRTIAGNNDKSQTQVKDELLLHADYYRVVSKAFYKK